MGDVVALALPEHHPEQQRRDGWCLRGRPMSHKPSEDGGSHCLPSLQVKNKWILSMPTKNKQDDHWSTIELFTRNELVTSR